MHAARSLTDRDLTGRATFKERGSKLDIVTANKRPLENLFEVGLVYIKEFRGTFVKVQYKMLEPQASTRGASTTDPLGGVEFGDEEWIVRIDDQFEEEMERMRRFDRDFDPRGPYRLHAGAFF